MGLFQQILAAEGKYINPLPAGVVAWFKGENNVNDEGGTYNATAGSTVAYGTGFDGVGQAFKFDGTVNARVLVPTINLGGTYTIQAWVKVISPANNTSYGIVASNYAAGAGAFSSFNFLTDSVGKLILASRYNGSTNSLTSANYIAGQWYRVGLTYDGSKHRLYLNDLLIAAESSTHSETLNTQLGIGVPATSGILSSFPNTSLIDEVILSNVVQTITPLVGVTSNLAMWWKCDTVNDSAYTWAVINGSAPAYGTGQDSVANGAFAFDSSANAKRFFPIIGSTFATWTIDFDLFIDSGHSGFFGVIYKGRSDAGFGGLIWDSGTFGTNCLHFWNNGTNRAQTGTNTLPVNTWKHVKVTYDASKIRIYIDGSLAATESATHSQSWSVDNTVIFGGSDGSVTSGFFGRLDNIKVYNAVV